MIKGRVRSLVESHWRITLPLLGCLVFARGTGNAVSGQTAPGALVLHESIQTEALPLISGANYLGLGAEATRLETWIRDHVPPLTLRSRGPRLQDAKGGSTRLSNAMAQTLERLHQWYGLVATSLDPITHEQLRTAALSEASVGRIRSLFETAIGMGVRVHENDQWLIPEIGGEATLDSELRLVAAPDPGWATVKDLVLASADPGRAASLYDSLGDEVAKRIDTHSLLKLAVARFRLGARDAREEVRRAIVTIARNTAPTYSHGPEEQFRLIATNNWRGRYVGRWHTHAPRDAGGEWTGSDGPSFEDMENAVRDGQYLTLAFQPGGFDLYDAEPLADASRVDLGLLKVIRYRSPSWRKHFQQLHPGAGNRG